MVPVYIYRVTDPYQFYLASDPQNLFFSNIYLLTKINCWSSYVRYIYFSSLRQHFSATVYYTVHTSVPIFSSK